MREKGYQINMNLELGYEYLREMYFKKPSVTWQKDTFFESGQIEAFFSGHLVVEHIYNYGVIIWQVCFRRWSS